jgi:uncharacterized protein YdaU (DUF1376 family)
LKFYKRFPGDITIKTGDLSLVEFGAYDRLLDHYYAKEQPIDPTRVYTVTRCQSPADRKAVDAVLAEYWTLTPAGWVQERADEMIAEALPKIEAARENGKKGGRPPGSKNKPKQEPKKNPLGSQTETKQGDSEKASQSQISSLRSEHSEPDGSGGEPPADPPAPPSPPPAPTPPPAAAPVAIATPKDIVFALGVPLLTAAGVKESNARSFLGMRSKTHGDPALAAALQECAAEAPVQPIPWLEKKLGPQPAGKAKGGHSFAGKDYSKGVNADGSFT